MLQGTGGDGTMWTFVSVLFPKYYSGCDRNIIFFLVWNEPLENPRY